MLTYVYMCMYMTVREGGWVYVCVRSVLFSKDDGAGERFEE